MVPLKIVSNVSRFKPALNLNRVLADLNRGSNSLNSISGGFVQVINLEDLLGRKPGGFFQVGNLEDTLR